jgi:hypothetical protein
MTALRLWGFAVGAMLGYTASLFVAAIPLLSFYPVSSVWTFRTLEGEPSITWLRRLLFAAVTGGLGFAASPLARRPRWRSLFVLAVLAILLLAWHEREWLTK